MSSESGSVPSAPSIRSMRAALRAAKIDCSDCFELDELRARFHSALSLRAVGQVERLRLKANGAFKRASYELAIRLYTHAIAQADALRIHDAPQAATLLGTLFSNRSAAYRALRMPARALSDAREAVSNCPAFLKGRVRLAQALHAIGRTEEALIVLDEAVACGSSDHRFLEDNLEEIKRLRGSITGDATPKEHKTELSTVGNDISVRVSEGMTTEDEEAGATSGRVSILLLPEDALTSILGQLEVVDLGRTMSVCRALFRLATVDGLDSVWYHVCNREFPAFCLSMGAPCAKADTYVQGAVGVNVERSTDADGRYSARLMDENSSGHASVQSSVRDSAHLAAETAGLSLCSASAIGFIDWQVALRERRAHAKRWACGRRSERWLQDHAGPVYSVRLRGETLVSSSDDSTIKVWDLTRDSSGSNGVTHTLTGHSHGILGLWLHPDLSSPTVVSGGFDAMIRIWDISGDGPHGTCVRSMAGHAGPIVAIEADRDRILSTSFDGTLRVWRWDGQEALSIDAHNGQSSGLAIVDEGYGIAAGVVTGGHDGLVKRWNVETSTCVEELDVHTGQVWCVRARGPVLMTAATDGAMYIFDLRASEKPVHGVVAAHDDAVAGLQFDDTKAVTSSFDSTIRIWELRSLWGRTVQCAEDIQHVTITSSWPNGGARHTRLAYDDTRIVAGSLGGRILVADIL